MKYFDSDDAKNAKLRAESGIGLEDASSTSSGDARHSGPPRITGATRASGSSSHTDMSYDFPLLGGGVATGKAAASKRAAVASTICVVYDSDQSARNHAYPFSLAAPETGGRSWRYPFLTAYSSARKLSLSSSIWWILASACDTLTRHGLSSSGSSREQRSIGDNGPESKT